MNGEDLQQIRGLLKEELKTYHEGMVLPAFGKYTEEIVLPAIDASEERMKNHFTQELGKLRSDMIDHVSRQTQS